ncbi:MAG: ATP phosphoribosyltransferase [Deltaproteobacteria bacterium]|nr:ATP phosphoribosyltransferase [Deltaproteobacteria bacterium]
MKKTGIKTNKSWEETLTIALPKGRILKETAALFKAAGFDFSELLQDDRKLLYEDPVEGLRFMILRNQDIPTYVEYGAADLGIAGRDILIEQAKDLYEPLDLGIGACRMMVAEPAELVKRDNPRHWTHIRVATKYPNITLKHFLNKGIQAEIIKLYGSIELAPLLGLSERIVDLVQTGETLRKNGLVEVEDIMQVTSKLICNRASLKTKPKRVKELVERLGKAVGAKAKG